jgi:haloalkane dehalogenase
MKWIVPEPEELSYLRADPLLWEQELDVRPAVAEALERETGMRAGQVYWRSAHDHLYGLELADLGRGRPSMARVFGYWERYEPRPPEHEIDADLMALSLWVAQVGGMNPADVEKVAQHAGIQFTWPEDSVLRTPDDRFALLPGFPYEPQYVEIEGLRMAYVEAGAGDPILMLHGEPAWGYLYRRMIPPLQRVGRAIVPDLVGFGRSDKPRAANAYSYRAHTRWLRGFVESLGLERITLVCQDWGGLLGLRLLAQMPKRFARLVAMNTGFPDGRGRNEAFLKWRRFSQRVEFLDVAQLMRNTVRLRSLSDEEAASYQAPFPAREYQTAALTFPRLVPVRWEDPGAYENRVALRTLRELKLPVFLAWGEEDPITRPAEAWLREIFPHAMPTYWVRGAGHFVQEEAGEEIAARVAEWTQGARAVSE